MRFTKMHGCGNDYVYVDGWDDPVPSDPAAMAPLVSNRRTGIGADGLILVLPPSGADHDAVMRMFNADGSESEMCGNGIRCAARLAWERGHVRGSVIRFATGAGPIITTIQVDENGACQSVSVNMGTPRLDPSAIPLRGAESAPAGLELAGLTFHAVGMGNPHAVTFVDDPDACAVTTIGPQVEHDEHFPARTNVEFIARLADEQGVPVLRQRTWERGSGETMACGTGACASHVAAVLTGRIPPGRSIVRLNGGDLHIDWPGEGPVTMTGEAIPVFSGEWPDPSA